MLAFVAAFLAAIAAPPSATADRAPAATVQTEPTEVAVASYNRMTGQPGAVRRELLRTTFDDGSPVKDATIARRGSRYYLDVLGGEGDRCRIDRVELVPYAGFLRIKNTGATASCSGDPCSSCKFVENKDGVVTGCKCADGSAGGKCNHTISTNTAFSVLSAAALRR